jgi:hypothetical protein
MEVNEQLYTMAAVFLAKGPLVSINRQGCSLHGIEMVVQSAD